MMDRYWMIKENLRWALAMPPFINLIIIPCEMIIFLWHYRSIREKHIEGGFWDLLDMYLCRNNSEFIKHHVKETAEDNYDRLRLQAFMERAKASYLEDGEFALPSILSPKALPSAATG